MIHPAYSQKIEGARAGRDINQSLNVVDGSTLDAGIWHWSSWREKALAFHLNSAGAHATRLLASGLALPRPESTLIAESAERFLNDDPHAPQTVALYGKHGTGRSTLMMAVAFELADKGFGDIFVADDYMRFAQTDLRRVLPTDRKSVLIIDDADLQGAVRPVYNCRGSGILALGSFSRRRGATTFLGIGGRQYEPVTLADRPDAEQLGQLADVLQAPRLPKDRQNQLNRCNFRSAYRILKGEPPPLDLALQLVDLRFEGHDIELAVSLLTWCGTHDVLVPVSVLRRAVNTPVIEELEPWLQSRPIFDSAGEASAVWIEDQAVMNLAMSEWKKHHVVDKASFDWEIGRNIDAVLGVVNATKAPERVFTRQVIRIAEPQVAREAVERGFTTIVNCIHDEIDRGALLAWASAIPPGSDAAFAQLRDAVQDHILQTNPDFGAVIAFVTGESEREMSDDAVATAAKMIPIEQWADVLELCQGRSGGVLGVPTFHTALNFIRRHPDAEEILKIKNSAQIIATRLIRDPQPGPRIWLRDLLIDQDRLSPADGKSLLALCERCIGQRRHRVTMQSKWDPPNADQNMVDSLRGEYMRLWETRAADRVDEVTDVVLTLLNSGRAAGGQAGTLWAALFKLARNYLPERVPHMVGPMWTFVRSAWETARVRDSSLAAQLLLRTDAVGGHLSPQTIREALQALDGDKFEPLLVRLLGDSAWCAGDASVAQASICILRSSLESDPQRRADGISRGWESLLRAVNFEPRGALRAIDGHDMGRMIDALPSEVIINVGAFPDTDREADLASMVRRWGHKQAISLFSVCLSHNALRLAMDLVPNNWPDDRNWSIQMARLRALQGRLTDARKLLIEGAALGGSNPTSVSRAQHELAKRTTGYEKQMWQMLTALNRPRVLDELPEG